MPPARSLGDPAQNEGADPSRPPPCVALLIAAHNAEATIERSIRTALAQPAVREVCVIDDASRDATQSIARRCASMDARVSVVALTVNVGPAAARNAGIAATTSPWIGILDADDYLLPKRTERLLQVSSNLDFVADALIRITPSQEPQFAQSTEPLATHPLDFLSFVEGNHGQINGTLDLGYIKPLMRRAFLDAHGLRYREEMRLGEDYELYARALTLGARFGLTPHAGYVSVEREGSLSRNHSETDLQHLRDCDDGLAQIRPLSVEERRALTRHRTSVDCRLQWRRLISAVKARNLGAALSTFHSPAAAGYLAVRLGEQAGLRFWRAITGGAPAAEPRDQAMLGTDRSPS